MTKIRAHRIKINKKRSNKFFNLLIASIGDFFSQKKKNRQFSKFTDFAAIMGYFPSPNVSYHKQPPLAAPSSKPFPCWKCGRTYQNKGSLKRHLHDECGKEPKYICRICVKGFKQKANYKRHVTTIHQHPPQFRRADVEADKPSTSRSTMLGGHTSLFKSDLEVAKVNPYLPLITGQSHLFDEDKVPNPYLPSISSQSSHLFKSDEVKKLSGFEALSKSYKSDEEVSKLVSGFQTAVTSLAKGFKDDEEKQKKGDPDCGVEVNLL